MNVSDIFKNDATAQLDKLSALLEQLYGLRIDWDSGDEHLASVLEHYESKRFLVVTESAQYANSNPEYTKNVLICESIKIYLKEIAPMRKKKGRRK